MPSKAVERAILDLCQQNVAEFPQGSVKERESPDFELRTANRIVGVEMQEFIQQATKRGAPGRLAESLRAKVMRFAQTEFESAHPNLFLYVYSGWAGWGSLDEKALRPIAHRLGALVEVLVPQPPTNETRMTTMESSYEDRASAGLPDHLTHLAVHRYVGATYGLWAATEAGIASTDVTDLQRQISAKESRVPTYRASCDEIWLVLYGLAYPSGGFDLEALGGFRVGTPFDHVVFIDAVSSQYAMLAG
jgi:hypothetical protein